MLPALLVFSEIIRIFARYMREKEILFLKGMVRWALLALFGTVLLSRCANMAAPQGGPRDSLPPKVVLMNPGYGTTKFAGKRIFIEFNEYVQVKNQQKEIFVSPFMEKKPVISLRGKGVQIDLKQDLDSNQTYAINFGKSIQDNNEGNPYTGLRYVFSTGSEVDSLLMSGYTVDALTADTVGNAFIFFFDPKADSLPATDSTMFKSKPLVVARSYSNGVFLAENLKPMDYRVYALLDKNGNQQYEPGVDRIGFLDSVYNPLSLPPFDVWYDTVAQQLQANPQLYIRLFMDKPYKRQVLSTFTRPLQNKLVFKFAAPDPTIERLSFAGIDSTAIITEYLNANRDSIAFWLNVPKADLSDSLVGELVYLRHDSVGQLYTDTKELKLNWKKPFEKEKSKREKEEEANKKPANPFQMKMDIKDKINPEHPIRLTFDYPLVAVDSSRIVLEIFDEEDPDAEPKSPPKEAPKEGEKKEEAKTQRVKATFRRDTANLREWQLTAPWEIDRKYRLLIPSETFTNLNEELNDTIKSTFTVDTPDKYASIIFTLLEEDPQAEYIIQLIDKDKKVIQERAHLTAGKHTFRYIPAGEVRVRVIEDNNRNGKWDAGDLIKRIQSEKVVPFTTESGEEVITAKVNWELEFDLDPKKLFAPVTMEQMNAQIERARVERERIEAEKKAEKEKQRKKQDSHSTNNGSNRDMTTGTSGAGGANFRTRR